eukprot:TRINITY_DN2237_c0_g1_i1.p1 TRINITY_DN2237_c0_g1~~TRINITY_DN2237_c0_g1_i1.p1  ORF type:complete len:561 (+),score=126.67 TRINITY_DN2237_c0_g1_i1:87-1769(+)
MVEVLRQTKEWGGIDDSDDERGTHNIQRRASASFDAREKRLSLAVEVMRRSSVMGDKEVQVVTHHKELAGVEDSDDEVKPQHAAERRASASFAAREKRLSVAQDVMKQLPVMGDNEVKVVSHHKELAGVEDSDDEVKPQHAAERRASASFAAREKRLSVAQEVMKQMPLLGDREVQVVSHDRELRGAEDLEEESPEQLATASFEAREKRLSSASVVLQPSMGYKEVQVVPEKRELLGVDDSDGDEVGDAHFRASFAAREKRLSQAIEVMQQTQLMGDRDVQVISHPQELPGAEDSEDEAPLSPARRSERRASASFTAREKRLSVAADVMKQAQPMGDREVHVVPHGTELAGAAESDEDTGPAHFQRRASSSFEARERRLSMAAEVSDPSMGFQEVQVVPQEKELRGVEDSDDEAGPRVMHRRASDAASASFASRERRLTAGEEAMRQAAMFGDREVEVVPHSRDWQCADGHDSHDESDDGKEVKTQRQLIRRASASFEAREQRLSVAAAARRASSEFSDGTYEGSRLHVPFDRQQSGLQGPRADGEDRCVDRCSWQCALS